MTKSKIWKGSLISKAEFLLQWGSIVSHLEEYSLVFRSTYLWGKKGPYWFRSKSLISSFLKASFMRMTGIGWLLFSESKGYSTSTSKGFYQKKTDRIFVVYVELSQILSVKTCKLMAILKMINTLIKTTLRFSSAVKVWTIRSGFTPKSFRPVAPAPEPDILCSQALVAPCAQEYLHLLPEGSASKSFLSSGEDGVTWGLRLPEDLFSSTSYCAEGWDSTWGAKRTFNNNACWYWTFSICYVLYCVMVNATVLDV